MGEWPRKLRGHRTLATSIQEKNTLTFAKLLRELWHRASRQLGQALTKTSLKTVRLSECMKTPPVNSFPACAGSCKAHRVFNQKSQRSQSPVALQAQHSMQSQLSTPFRGAVRSETPKASRVPIVRKNSTASKSRTAPGSTPNHLQSGSTLCTALSLSPKFAR